MRSCGAIVRRENRDRENIFRDRRKRSRGVSRRCCARLTCPRSPFYQPLLPPSGTKNCVCTDYMPVEYLSRFDANSYVRDARSRSPSLSDRNERAGIRRRAARLLFRGGDVTFFWLSTTDSIVLRGDFPDTRAVFSIGGRGGGHDDATRGSG